MLFNLLRMMGLIGAGVAVEKISEAVAKVQAEMDSQSAPAFSAAPPAAAVSESPDSGGESSTDSSSGGGGKRKRRAPEFWKDDRIQFCIKNDESCIYNDEFCI